MFMAESAFLCLDPSALAISSPPLTVFLSLVRWIALYHVVAIVASIMTGQATPVTLGTIAWNFRHHDIFYIIEKRPISPIDSQELVV